MVDAVVDDDATDDDDVDDPPPHPLSAPATAVTATSARRAGLRNGDRG
jgi:hypothetical protein